METFFCGRIGILRKSNTYMLDVYIVHYTNVHLTFLTNTICPLYVPICEAMYKIILISRYSVNDIRECIYKLYVYP